MLGNHKRQRVKGMRQASRRTPWDEFDGLPSETKAVIHNAPLKIALKRGDKFFTRRDWLYFKELMARRCLETYGPDHPQAYRPGMTEQELWNL